MIIIKKKKKKNEKNEKKFKYFEKFNVKKYCDKEEFQHFSFNVFENFRIIKNFNFNILKFEKTLFVTFIY